MYVGILNILANATSGISIVLEHRYYGRSLPANQSFSLSTDDLRFLTSEQALLDSVRFIQHLDLGFLDSRLHGKTGSDDRPWFAYGGSYAGAMTAFLVKGWGANGTMINRTPPEHPAIKYAALPTGTKNTRPLIWGGIASSAVTHAQISFPEYFEAIRQAAPAKCMRTLEQTVEAIDKGLEVAGGRWKGIIKGLFGLEGLKSDADFAEVRVLPLRPIPHRTHVLQVISSVLGSWQARNWDPAGEPPTFRR